ncbi:hypothetical protein ABPG74_014388 [Tetrahymena malaccensis]
MQNFYKNQIQNIKLCDERDLYVIQIQFNEEENPREGQKQERYKHYITQGMEFIVDNSNLKIQLGKNELKDINPYILLNKLIEKIGWMFMLQKFQKDQFMYYPIVKSFSFNWICIDLELQFFEKPTSQHQIQIQDTFKARISNILYSDLLKEINSKSQDESVQYQIQIIKKITDKDQQRYYPEIQEDQFFMNQVYNIQDPIVNQIELLCLILYTINFEGNQNKYMVEDSFDHLFFCKRIKHIAQNKSVCLNISRMFQVQNNYFQEIQTNPFIIYKSMPFSITLLAHGCQECSAIGYLLDKYMKDSQHYNQICQSPDSEQTKQEKEMLENSIADQKQKLQSKKEENQTHTRVIYLQINIMQDIFQNQYEYDQIISQHIFDYLKTLQILYCKFFMQLEGILNPTKNSILKMFEMQNNTVAGSIFNRKAHTIQHVKVFYTDYDKLHIFYRNLKSFTCQIQKLLRQVYFMNLLGKDPNDLGSLNKNQPYFNFDINEDLKNQQISFEVKRQGLDFSLLVKSKFDNQLKLLCYQILFKQIVDTNNPLAVKENKDIPFQEVVKMIFRSIQSIEIDRMPIENQIKHINNYYSLAQQYLKNPEDQFYLQIIQCLKYLDRLYVFTDFSKKDQDIKHLESKGIQQPKYLFEVKQFYEFTFQNFLAFSIKIYFGTCIENKFFILLEKSPNEFDVKYVQVTDIQQHVSEFMKRYAIQI